MTMSSGDSYIKGPLIGVVFYGLDIHGPRVLSGIEWSPIRDVDSISEKPENLIGPLNLNFN